MTTDSPDLLYIVNIANRSGRMAVIDGGSVAVFTPIRREMEDGFEHITFRVDRVRTVAQIWSVLEASSAPAGALEWRRSFA